MFNVLCTVKENCPLPSYATDGAAAVDLRAVLSHPIALSPGAWVLIPTGSAVAMPHGMAALVLPRSGLALKHGVTVLNSPGLIDSDYRGTIGVILINHGDEYFEILNGDRIAQLMFIEDMSALIKLCVVSDLPPTTRGLGGFGSSGVK